MGDTPASIIRDLVDEQSRLLGVDVLAVELKGEGSRQLLRVVVDRRGGISLGVCQELSHQLSRRLDDIDPIGGRYTLEVTSPGTDWPLTGKRDFARIQGRQVLIHRRREGDRVEQLKGRVVDAGDGAVEIDAEGRTVTIAYDEIVKATQALPW